MTIIFQGAPVNISHLAQITRQMTLDLRGGKQKKNAHLEISFSNHCYSFRPPEGQEISLEMRVRDGSRHMPRDRIFCPRRYEYSLRLVDELTRLIESNGMVRKSRHCNFFSTTVVKADRDGCTVEESYYIFISARKAQDPGKPHKLVLYVESAYPGSPDIPSPVGEGDPMPLSEMLGKVWENSKIRR